MDPLGLAHTISLLDIMLLSGLSKIGKETDYVEHTNPI